MQDKLSSVDGKIAIVKGTVTFQIQIYYKLQLLTIMNSIIQCK